MFCTQCGNQINDLALICPKCGAIAGDPGNSLPASAELPPAAIPSHLAGAILATIFCCMPFGIPAIVSAARVNGLLSVGNTAGAKVASARAGTWMWIAFGFGFLQWGALLLYIALIVVSEAAAEY